MQVAVKTMQKPKSYNSLFKPSIDLEIQMENSFQSERNLNRMLTHG